MPNVPSIGKPLSKLTSLYQQMMAFHNDVLDLLAQTTTELQRADANMAEVADIGFLSRELGKTCDELRKEFNARMELAGKRIAVNRTEASLKNPNASMTIQGALASATADVKMEAPLPKSGTPEMAALLQHIGVSPALVESGLVKPDWKLFQAQISRATEDGTPLPPGIGKPYPRFTAEFRRKRST